MTLNKCAAQPVLQCMRAALLLALLILLLPVAASAKAKKDKGKGKDKPATTEPAALAPLTAEQQAIADMFDPQLFQLMDKQWRTDPGHTAALVDTANYSVLSLPSGIEVYLCRQDEIPGAKNEDGRPASVEDVVFSSGHLLGTTPVTFPLPAGDYVLALRPLDDARGFDGGCVRKAAHDVVTGTQRQSYHLYPLSREDGQYECFVASFANPDDADRDLLRGLAAPWTFHLPGDALGSALESRGIARQELWGRIAEDLNSYGLAFYNDGQREWLVKLSLRGAGFELAQWPVQYGSE